MLTSFDVADYFLAKIDADAGDVISSEQLQQLVYCAQGAALAAFEKPLFAEAIVAGERGPVVPELEVRYAPFGANGIPEPETVDYAKYSREVQAVLDDVYADYGQFAAWKLSEIVREEAPWKTTARGEVIPLAVMEAHFKAQAQERMESRQFVKRWPAATLTCFDVAAYFLAKAEAAGDAMTNLRLQKLVYYAQGFALAILGRPLFGEALMAWQSGPVVPELYFKHEPHGAKRLPAPKDWDVEKLNDDEQALLDDVYAACGQFAAWKLANKVRAEAPWKDAPMLGEISLEAMEAFFKMIINVQC